MRTIIIISLVLVLPTILLAQQTYVPDDKFEQYLINRGLDEGPLNDSVPTKNIDKVTIIAVLHGNISDLTGIEDFTALLDLRCSWNKLTSLDVSNNAALEVLLCRDNKLTSLDVSNNNALKQLDCVRCNLTSLDVSNNNALQLLYCGANNLTSLDVSNNNALQDLYCGNSHITNLDLSNNTALLELSCGVTNLTSLDLSNNSALIWLYCLRNNLTSLDIKNGNNENMYDIGSGFRFDARINPNLHCIQVDDSTYSANINWWYKDSHAHYSEDCGYTGIDLSGEDGNDNISISSSPNPFSNSTMINYQLAMSGNVVLNVYDIFGNEVATLLNEFKDAGTHSCVFNSDNLSSGVYFYKIQIDNAIKSGHLLLIK